MCSKVCPMISLAFLNDKYGQILANSNNRYEISLRERGSLFKKCKLLVDLFLSGQL